VQAGGVRCDHAPGANVLAVLPLGSYSACYRDALRSSGGSTGEGSATLHVVFDSEGWVSSASFTGPQGLTSVGQCIDRATAGTGKRVHDIQGGAGAIADVDLVFKSN
jgi:hypothetical protein